MVIARFLKFYPFREGQLIPESSLKQSPLQVQDPFVYEVNFIVCFEMGWIFWSP